MNLLDCFAPCPRGLEKLLAQELQALPLGELGQLDQLETVPGGVHFQADWAGIMQANLWSRLASRILLRLDRQSYRNENDLYDIAHAQNWETWFSVADDFRVDVTGIHSPLRSLDFATLKIKDAVCDFFRERSAERPSIDTKHPDIRIQAFLDATSCTLYLDTSGEALFKRGWRLEKGAAPIRENLAAALLLLADWPDHPSASTLLDPFCGSGTILVEALLLSLNIAPGLARGFGFERLRRCPLEQWQLIRQQARRSMRTTSSKQIHGSDIDPQMVYQARRNIERAAIVYDLPEHTLLPVVTVCNAPERPAPAHTGVIVTNPPYGERMQAIQQRPILARSQRYNWKERQPAGSAAASRTVPLATSAPAIAAEQATDENAQATQIFSAWASNLKQHFAGWCAYVISGDLQLPKKMRLKEGQRTPLFNGALECRYFRFDMVAGSARNIRPIAKSGA